MIYCVRCINYQDAQNRVRLYMKELKAQLSEIRRYRANPVIVLKNKDEIHFVTFHEYKTRWNFGRVYKFIGDDTLYHGLYPVKNKSSD